MPEGIGNEMLWLNSTFGFLFHGNANSSTSKNGQHAWCILAACIWISLGLLILIISFGSTRTTEPQPHIAQEAWQPIAVVAVHVRDEDLRDLRGAHGGSQKLMLSACGEQQLWGSDQ